MAAALLAAIAGPECASRASARRAPAAPPEVLVEVLPRSAEVRLDGRVVRRGAGTAPVPAGVLAGLDVTFSADGFVSEVQPVPEGGLAGARVGAALRPEGFGGPPLDLDDGASLAGAAAFLLASGDARDAADYAERAVSVAPGVGAAHRVLGDARRALGDQDGAVRALSEYLRLMPQAPDAPEVARRLDEVRAAGAAADR